MNADTANHSSLPSVHRWAMFVGVNHYFDEDIRSLRYCVNDARELHDLLVTSPHSGYAPERACLLMSASAIEAEATRRNTLKQLQSLANQARPEDMLLFYFAGHGQSIGQEVFLFPADTESDHMIQDTAISLSRVKQILESSQARARAIILDACYTGVALRGLTPRSVGAPDKEMLERFLLESEGLALLYSTARSDAAFEWEEMEHGVFTYYLLEGLRGPASDRQNRVLTVTEIHRYVSAKVGLWAEQHKIPMRPTVEFSGRGDLVVAATESTNQEPQITRAEKIEETSDMQYASTEALLASLRGGQRGFVGRVKELQRVFKLIRAAPNLASLVIGGPGVGKTTFFNQMRYRLANELSGEENPGQRRFHVFSIEPGTLSSCDDFAAELRGGLIRCVDPSNLQQIEQPHKLTTFGEFFAQIEVIQQQIPDATFVVFLDAFDKVFHRFTDLEQQRIRDLINTLVENDHLHIMFVLSVLEELPPRYASRLSADVFTLHPLTQAENDELVLELLRPHISPTATESAWIYDHIYDHTGGHPYLTRLLIVKLLDLAPWANARPGIQEDNLEEAATAAVHSDRADQLFGWIYDSYLNDDQRFVLLSLAASGQRVLSADEFARMTGRHKKAVKELVSRDYFSEFSDGTYRMRIGFFIDWLFAWESFDREVERLQVLEKRLEQSAPPAIDRKGLCIDLLSRRVYIEGREIGKSLPDRPYRALIYLAKRVDQVVSKDDLANELWPDEPYDTEDQRIAMVVSRLRQALGEGSEAYLQTLHKQGYRLQNATFLKTASAPR